MGALPKVDPELNRELIAQRLGWPEGAVEESRAVEAEEPGWQVWYVIGGLPSEPEPGFTARQAEGPYSNERLFAASAAELLRAIRRERPHPPITGFRGPPIWG
ncbi:hypothetical protein J7E99_14990 [Streptomyces sp. ISL-44]|uniref:hypothetical protein n=1 Tax=Streptomyces sp. ISL-44 TaxID=2819184 RepID=UPI001BE71A62|nr:hypothetical protein [Streptomyces sp. ISL-44]MBT2541975.1 hypothetical protein [Streptomyces sp. ISL-44]